MEIWRITAVGNVKVMTHNSTAYGDKAIYNVDKEMAIMTGKNLSLTTPDQKVIAQERFEYWVETLQNFF